MGVNLSSLPLSESDQDQRQASMALAADYTGVAILSIAAWDTLLCLRAEYLIIWRARSTVLKWCYLATRYLGIATGSLLVASNASPILSGSNACRRLTISLMTLATTASTFALLIRSYRILAIFNFNQTILILLSSTVLVTAVLQYYILTKWQGAIVADGIVGCYPSPNHARIWEVVLYWVPSILASTILFILVLYRGISRYRDARESKVPRIPLYMIFWRDGARFQIVILAINVTALILYLNNDPLLGPLFLSIASVGTTTIVCRLVHSLRSQINSVPGSIEAPAAPEPRSTASYICGDFGAVETIDPAAAAVQNPPLATLETIPSADPSEPLGFPPSSLSTPNHPLV